MTTNTGFKVTTHEDQKLPTFQRHPAQVIDQDNLMKDLHVNHATLYQRYIENREHESTWSTETRRQKHKEIKKLIDEMEDQLQLARNYY